MTPTALYSMVSFYFLVSFFFASVVFVYVSPNRWHILLTIFLGLVTAFIEVQSYEVSFSVLLLLAFGFFLGFTKPATPFRTASLFAIWLPLMTFFHLAMTGSKSSFVSAGVGSFVAFIPAVGGSYLGALIRKHSADTTLNRDALI